MCAALVKKSGNLIEVAADFAVLSGQLPDSGQQLIIDTGNGMIGRIVAFVIACRKVNDMQSMRTRAGFWESTPQQDYRTSSHFLLPLFPKNATNKFSLNYQKWAQKKQKIFFKTCCFVCRCGAAGYSINNYSRKGKMSSLLADHLHENDVSFPVVASCPDVHKIHNCSLYQ